MNTKNKHISLISNLIAITKEVERDTHDNSRQIRLLAFELTNHLERALDRIDQLEDALGEYANENLWHEYAVGEGLEENTVWGFELDVPDPAYIARNALKESEE